MAVTTNRLGLLAAALLVLPATRVRGAGELDLGFGTNGLAGAVPAARAPPPLPPPAGGAECARSAGAGGRFALVRYMPNGALDATFGSGGAVTTAPGSDDAAMALVLEPNGKLVAAGVTRRGGASNFALVRYLPDGTLDAGFGPGGIVTTDLSGDDAATHLVLEPDGKLVAAGVSRRGGAGDFALVRYNRDGTLDGTFGAGGATTTD